MRSRTRALVAAGVAFVAIAVVVVALVVVFGHPQSDGAGQSRLADPPAPAPAPAHTSSSPHPAPTNVGEYVALGDSYAAGVGAGDEHGYCKVSPLSYPGLLNGSAGIVLAANDACNAATTSDVVADQLGSLSATTRLVTLSVGGNDLNVQSLARDCTGGGSGNCEMDFTSALTLMKTLPGNLRAAYRAVATAAPNAKIIVTGYPTLFASPKTNSLTVTSTTLLNAATEELDLVITNAVGAEHRAGLNIGYVGVDFTAHGIGSATPWIVATGSYAFHPNATGYRAYAAAVLAAL